MSDSTPLTDADRIRLKRLAKLQGPASSSTPSTPPPQQQQQAQASTSKPVIPQSSSPAPPRVTSPPKPVATPPITTPVKKKAPEFDPKTWESETIERVFGLGLDKDICVQNKLVWLQDLEQEQLSENPDLARPLRPGTDAIDAMIIARLNHLPGYCGDAQNQTASVPLDQTVLEFLVGCWRRLSQHRTVLTRKGLSPEPLAKATSLLDKMKELIISYAGLSLEEPTMFSQPENKPLGVPELIPSFLTGGSAGVFSTVAQTLLSPSEIDQFLTDLISRFEADGLEPILGGVVRSLAFDERLSEGVLQSANIWNDIGLAWCKLTALKPVANMIVNMDEWALPDAEGDAARVGRDIEKRTLLGPLFRLGVLGRDWPNIVGHYYADFDDQNSRSLEGTSVTLNNTLKTIRGFLFRIVDNFVRAGPGPREKVLSYVATMIALNPKRTAMRSDYAQNSSDSFMANWLSVLQQLAEPFMDSKFSKLNKVDLHYYQRSSRISLKDQTRINADQKEVDEWDKSAPPPGPIPNFISDVFYLTAAMNNLTFKAIEAYIQRLSREVRNLNEQIEATENDPTWRTSPMAVRIEASIKAGKAQVLKMKAFQQTCFVDLLSLDGSQRGVNWASFVSTWLLSIVDPAHNHPQKRIKLPLPQEPPLVWKILPEYFVEDVVDFWVFILAYSPMVIARSGFNEVIDFSMTFLTSTWYLTNPYLKSKLITALSAGVRKSRSGREGVLVPYLCSHPLAMGHLIVSLMSFYVECEKTGTHTQFYDKFTIRHEIASIMEAVWQDPHHRSVMRNFTNNMGEFIKFANRLMNDVTFLLDEQLTKLAEIRKIQQEMERQAEWAALTQEQRQDRTSALRSAEGQASSWSYYSKSMLVLLIEFTETTRKAFVSGEIVDRLAAMLNHVLEALVGPSRSHLRTNDMEKYGFDPKELLKQLLQVYLNLSEEVEFVKAIASEGRSYKKELFDAASHIAIRHSLQLENDMKRLQKFVARVEEVRVTMEEEDVDDAPEDYLDPLMATIMREPVLLPSSKSVMDLSTIKQHLLSDPTDPFNRVPLKIEDVIPQPELKAQIQAYLADKRDKATANKLASMQQEVKEEHEAMEVDVEKEVSMEVDA